MASYRRNIRRRSARPLLVNARGSLFQEQLGVESAKHAAGVISAWVDAARQSRGTQARSLCAMVSRESPSHAVRVVMAPRALWLQQPAIAGDSAMAAAVLNESPGETLVVFTDGTAADAFSLPDFIRKASEL